MKTDVSARYAYDKIRTVFSADRTAKSICVTMGAFVIFILDRTGSMRRFIQPAKKRIITMCSDLRKVMQEKNYDISSLKAVVIDFGDLYFEKDWIHVSPVFELTDDPLAEEAFANYVNSIHAHGGGGDGPESSLEALNVALNMVELEGFEDRNRYCYVVLSDAAGHELDDTRRRTCRWYPQDIAENMDDLNVRWLYPKWDIRPRDMRMLLFTPNCYPWNEMAQKMERVNWCESIAGNGLAELSMDTIYRWLRDSI